MAAAASSSLHDPQRLAALRSTGLLDTPAEEDFDRLTRLAAQTLRAPMAAINLVDDSRHFFKSAVGLPEPFRSARQIPLPYSFCKYVVGSGRRLVVQDARAHRWLRKSPAIQELGMISYAGVPLRTSSGHTLGSFCVSDSVPRGWTKEELRALEDLARLAVEHIVLRASHPPDPPEQDRSWAAITAIEELLSTTARFHALVEQSIVGIGIVQAGRIRYVNSAFSKMFGYTEEEILALASMLELVAEEDRANVADLWKRIDGGVESLRYRFRGRCKNGRIVHVEVHGTRTVIDGTPAVVSVLLDVTERAQAEAALRSSEIRTRRLLDLAHDAFVAIDEDGIITDWNVQAEHTFGWSAADAVGARLVDTILPEEYRQAHEQGIEHFLGTGEGPILDRRVELVARHRDGHTLPVELAVTPIRFGDSYIFSSFLHDISERKHAEEALRQSEERYRRFFEDDLTGDLITTPEGQILACNPAFVRMFGYESVEEVLSGDAVRFFPGPKARERWLDRLRKQGRVELHESELVRKDGKRIQVLENAVGTFDQTGTLTEIRRYLFDITSRKEAEEALRQSEERLRLVVRATNDVLWEWDLASGRISWSEVAPKTFRYTAEEFGTSVEWWVERMHPEDRERVIGDLHGIMYRKGEFWSSEYRFLRGDGAYATVLDRGFVVRNERGNPSRMLGAMMDITERKRAEEAQRLLARASVLLESSLDPRVTLPGLARSVVPMLADYCLIDLVEDGQLHRVAAAHAVPAREALFEGWEPQPLSAQREGDPTARALDERRPILLTQAADRLLDASAADPEHRRRFRELGTRSLMIVPLLVQDEVLGVITLATAESGRPYGPLDLLVAEDLSRRISLALENARLYERAQEAVRHREQILGVVSHDLRNPLSTITLSAQLLQEHEKERRSGNLKWLDVILRSADQMERMIADLLDLSSIDAGRLSMSPDEQDATSLMLEVCDSFQPLAAEKSIEIRCDPGAERSTLWVDSHRIQRVFSNLVGNALKFTPQGGTITLRAERHEEGLCFSVSDSGPGMSEEQLTHVFDRYWQARKGDRRGAGLGLSIARGIVEAHGGRIWVESTPGQGTTFFFTVPATPR